MSAVNELSGTVLKGYQLGDLLGWTTSTAVYVATGRGSGRSVVKVVDSRLESSAVLADRLKQEAAALSELAHPAIVAPNEVGRSGRMAFAAAPYVQARSLRDVMEQGRIDNESAWLIVSGVAEALDAAHRRGLAHRELKPANILVDDRCGVHVTEFGVSGRQLGPLALSTPGYRLGEAQYLAPEQVEGRDSDARADVYALAVLVFELLTGTPLWGSLSLGEVLEATLSAPPPSAHARRPALPRSVDAVLARALAKDPEVRHRSATELLDALLDLPDEGGLADRRPAEAGPATAGTLVLAPKAPLPEDSMVTVLRRMGMPVLEARYRRVLTRYFAALMRYARETAGARWPQVLAASGLSDLSEAEPPADGERGVALEDASRLAAAMEVVFGLESHDLLRQWGRQTTEFWIHKNSQLQEGEVTYLMPIRMRAKPDQKVADVLYIFTRGLDRIRGEQLTTWKRVDKRQFWLVHYDNLMVVGRRRPARSCYFWVGAVEAALRWGGLANDWVVEEAECGCVTGTYTCVFTVQHAPF